MPHSRDITLRDFPDEGSPPLTFEITYVRYPPERDTGSPATYEVTNVRPYSNLDHLSPAQQAAAVDAVIERFYNTTFLI